MRCLQNRFCATVMVRLVSHDVMDIDIDADSPSAVAAALVADLVDALRTPADDDDDWLTD